MVLLSPFSPGKSEHLIGHYYVFYFQTEPSTCLARLTAHSENKGRS
jgi:hypothetical protein